MHTLKTTNFIPCIGLLLCFSVFANKTLEYPQWQQVGKAKLSVLWFDIYEAELSSANGLYDKNDSFKLTLTYLRDFEAEELIDETFNQISPKPSAEQEQAWRVALTNMWPKVSEGDQISFVKDKAGISHFFFNQNYLGEISDIEFGVQFANIWLAKDSAYPKLAARLKGENK